MRTFKVYLTIQTSTGRKSSAWEYVRGRDITDAMTSRRAEAKRFGAEVVAFVYGREVATFGGPDCPIRFGA